MDVDALFDEPTVALRGPWGGGDLVQDRARPRPTSPTGLYEYHLDFPGDALDPGLRLRAAGRAASPRATAADGLRPRRHRSRLPGPARAPVLDLLRLQRLEQPARGRLGDDPARLRRRRRRRGARRRSRREVGYSQHEGAERADWDDGPARGRRRHAPGRLPGRRLARELLRRRRSTSAARARRASAATTRPARPASCVPRVHTIPSDPADGARGLPLDRLRGPLGRAAAGVLQRPDRART